LTWDGKTKNLDWIVASIPWIHAL